MLEHYLKKDGKKLRYGYTTGTCAQAAAKAATQMLFYHKKIEQVTIQTEKGWELELEVNKIDICEEAVSCCVQKDSGDDPDITNGIEIYAKAEKLSLPKIEITGGIGIGKVTLKGLAVDVGEYAINPVPRQKIYDEVKSLLPKEAGIKITIYAPEGKELARKTFNSKLGIVDGISILGTTGIVEPMSEEAFKESLGLELSILKEKKTKNIILTPGNYGVDFTKKLNLDCEKIVKTSNFIGFMLDKANEHQMEKVLLIGHAGKLIKVAGGIFHTHSKIADGRMEILAAYTAKIGASSQLIDKILNSNTTDTAIQHIIDEDKHEVFQILINKISQRCRQRTDNKLIVGTIMFSLQWGMLGMCPEAENMLKEFKDE